MSKSILLVSDDRPLVNSIIENAKGLLSGTIEIKNSKSRLGVYVITEDISDYNYLMTKFNVDKFKSDLDEDTVSTDITDRDMTEPVDDLEDEEKEQHESYVRDLRKIILEGNDPTSSKEIDVLLDHIISGLSKRLDIPKIDLIKITYKNFSTKNSLDVDGLNDSIKEYKMQHTPKPAEIKSANEGKEDGLAKKVFENFIVNADNKKYLTEEFKPEDYISKVKENAIKMIDIFTYIKERLDKINSIKDIDEGLSKEVQFALNALSENDNSIWRFSSDVCNIVRK